MFEHYFALCNIHLQYVYGWKKLKAEYYASINLTSYHPPPGLTAGPLIFSVKIPAPGTAFQCKTPAPGSEKTEQNPHPWA